MADAAIQTVRCTTDVEVLRNNYTWVIKNFSFITTQKDKKIKSPIFAAGDNKEYKWRLRLYPDGKAEEMESFVALYLQLVSPAGVDVLAKFSFFIIMADGRKHKMASHQLRYFTRYKSFGDHELIKRNILLEERNGFVDNDNLTIVCEVSIGTGKMYEMIEEVHSPVVGSVRDSNLARHLEILLESKKLADVMLVAKDGGPPLMVHKAILAARSPVFAAMFQCHTQEYTQNKVEITDVTADVLEQMVRFLYTGKADNLDDLNNTTNLFAVADKYALNDLSVLCEQAIMQYLSVDNAIRALEFADRYNSKTLKDCITNFMRVHAQQMIDHFVNYITDYNARPARIWYDFSFFEL